MFSFAQTLAEALMKYSPVDPPVAAPSSARHMVIVLPPLHPSTRRGVFA